MFQRGDYVIDKESGELARVLKVMPEGERYFLITVVSKMYRIVGVDRVEEYDG